MTGVNYESDINIESNKSLNGSITTDLSGIYDVHIEYIITDNETGDTLQGTYEGNLNFDPGQTG